MKERPILFSAPMIRALLLGTKTQTRRVVKQQPRADYPDDESDDRFAPAAPGDRLWCKETWSPHIAHGCAGNTCDCADVNVIYEADGASRIFLEREIPNDWTFPKSAAKGLVSSLFMPRWASRLTLEVTGVRVERLRAITEEDAEAEGVGHCAFSARMAFESLWDEINGKRAPWSSNPWVWAVSFKRIEQPGAGMREMAERFARRSRNQGEETRR